MNLNVTLEFACYTQYGVYMYLCIYGKTLGPTITPQKNRQPCLIIIFTTQKQSHNTTTLCGKAIFVITKQSLIIICHTHHKLP